MHGTEGHVLGTEGVLGLSSPRLLLLHESERLPNTFSADVFETKPRKGPQSQHEHSARHLHGMFHVKHSMQLPNSMETQRSISPISRPCASTRIHLRHVPNHENSALAFSTQLSHVFLQKILLKTRKRPVKRRRPLRNASDTRSNDSEPVRLSYMESELDQTSAQLGE